MPSGKAIRVGLQNGAVFAGVGVVGGGPIIPALYEIRRAAHTAAHLVGVLGEGFSPGLIMESIDDSHPISTVQFRGSMPNPDQFREMLAWMVRKALLLDAEIRQFTTDGTRFAAFGKSRPFPCEGPLMHRVSQIGEVEIEFVDVTEYPDRRISVGVFANPFSYS